MKKFDRVLLASDFDNTLVDSKKAAQEGSFHPHLSEENHIALKYFMENGGRFAISTGRVASVFDYFVSEVPHNAPCVVANGAAIYDYTTKQYLYRRFLPAEARVQISAVFEKFPSVAMEIFQPDHVYAIHKNEYILRHEFLTKHPTTPIDSITQVEGEIVKCLFTGESEELDEIEAFLHAQPWASQYAVAKSTPFLLEVTSAEATKGKAVLALADLLDVPHEHIYCAGDECNDLSMLTAAAESFAPSNANPAVLAAVTHQVGHCGECAMADIVDYLDQKY